MSANMQDYLARKADGEVIEGSKKFKEVETLWTFELDNGKFKVANIDMSDMLSDYLRMAKDLPSIESQIGSPRSGA